MRVYPQSIFCLTRNCCPFSECTSAVSIDVEEQLYETAFEKGITCITISQKMTLPKCEHCISSVVLLLPLMPCVTVTP